MTLSKPFQFIVTRPNNRAGSLVDNLANLSTPENPVNIVHCPLIQIDDYLDGTANLSLPYYGVIFISGNSVNYAKKLLDSALWKQILSCPLYAIGEQTASILTGELKAHERQSKVIHPKQMNSEGLLAMSNLQAIENQNWLIVKGLGGREKLKNGLIQAGAKVNELAVYQRKLPDLETQKLALCYHQSNPCWLITSLQALTNLWRILEKQPQGCRIIVSSDRIAIQAKKMNFKVVAQSQDASDQQLIKTVQHIIQEQT